MFAGVEEWGLGKRMRERKRAGEKERGKARKGESYRDGESEMERERQSEMERELLQELSDPPPPLHVGRLQGEKFSQMLSASSPGQWAKARA